jgi:hypothetical protein
LCFILQGLKWDALERKEVQRPHPPQFDFRKQVEPADKNLSLELELSIDNAVEVSKITLSDVLVCGALATGFISMLLLPWA